MVTNVTI